MNKRLLRILAVLALCVTLLLPVSAFADTPTDEILSYQITADVNEDATVTFSYHLDWEVLVSDGIGPMSWVSIGIPNNSIVDYEAVSDNIDYIDSSSYSGSYLEVHFDDEYYQGDVCSFDFCVTLDNMYSVNALNDGETVIYFTPGWFDGISVDEIIVRWNNTGLTNWTGNCLVEDGYNVWTGSLGPGEKFESITLTYPNDAFAFDVSKQMMQGGDSSYDDYGYYDDDHGYSDSGSGELLSGLIGLLIWVFIILKIVNAVRKSKKSYEASSGFATGKTEKKITRTKVEYYDFCPGCGAPHEEGARTCKYCGRDMVKSEEIIEETSTNEDDKDALKYDKAGEYHYGSNPNTFVRVNVVRVPVSVPTPPPGGPRGGARSGRGGSSGRSGRGGSSGRGGGCAHSSCACACASCACACACACAGGGRAGCSTKDFYKTNLRLRQFELKAKKKNE